MVRTPGTKVHWKRVAWLALAVAGVFALIVLSLVLAGQGRGNSTFVRPVASAVAGDTPSATPVASEDSSPSAEPSASAEAASEAPAPVSQAPAVTSPATPACATPSHANVWLHLKLSASHSVTARAARQAINGTWQDASDLGINFQVAGAGNGTVSWGFVLGYQGAASVSWRCLWLMPSNDRRTWVHQDLSGNQSDYTFELHGEQEIVVVGVSPQLDQPGRLIPDDPRTATTG